MKRTNGFIVRVSIKVIDDREVGRLRDFAHRSEVEVGPGQNLHLRLGMIAVEAGQRVSSHLANSHLAERIAEVERGGGQ